jgi:hypothetical protein
MVLQGTIDRLNEVGRCYGIKLDLINLRKKLVKWDIWSIALCGAETWDTLESRAEVPGEF